MTIVGPYAEAYGRVLGGCAFYERGTPVEQHILLDAQGAVLALVVRQ